MPNGSASRSRMCASSRPISAAASARRRSPTPHGAIAAIAAKMLARPVKLAMTRPQTFTAIGGRPATRQTIALGATTRRQAAVDRASRRQRDVDERASGSSRSARSPRSCMRRPISRRARTSCAVNTVMPGALRAPGENPSAFGIECAIDELAYEVGIDPLAIRLLNYAEEDPHAKKPWSTRRLREAYRRGRGSLRLGASASPAPRSMRDGNAADRLGRGGGHLSGPPHGRRSDGAHPRRMARSRSRAAASTWDRAPIRSSRRRRPK